MKKVLYGGIGMLVAALLLVGGNMLSHSSASAQDATKASAVASLKITSESNTAEDGDAEHPGDEQVYTGDLLDADGNIIGEEHGACTVIDEDSMLCTAEDSFEDGNIITIGMSDEQEAGMLSELSIVGGTGAYHAAEGHVNQTSTDDDTVYEYTFDMGE